MGHYLIYYRSVRGRVLIARVLYGTRLQKKAWSEKPSRRKS
ncbi:hypothetical protein SBA4_1000014 [Candidatus Sulfopaludibacter sp. SbA4]|nr:hypothetical protein SBA4_1000014 [Candidatus Sulfopaludibacter sp. SbA4]